MIGPAFGTEPLEHLRILYLAAGNCLLRDELFTGTAAGEIALPVVAIMRHAVLLDAYALILVHNHPSGDPSPSRADVTATMQLVGAARLFGMAVLDHVVVAGERWSSLRQLGLL